MEEKSFLSKGFTMQFPIGDATIESVAVSGDKGVTTYDQEKNILKANKVGAVRYVLQLSNDVMLYEYVTVVQNRYIGDGCKKPTKVEQGQKGKALMKAYDGYYDRTGKLIIKAALMNHTSKKVTKKNIKGMWDYTENDIKLVMEAFNEAKKEVINKNLSTEDQLKAIHDYQKSECCEFAKELVEFEELSISQLKYYLNPSL